MTLASAPRVAAPTVTTESGLVVPAGFVDRDAVGGGGTVLVEDAFTEVGDTNLESHTPDVGGSWPINTDSDWNSVGSYRLQVGGGDGWMEIQTGSTKAAHYHDPSPTAEDFDIIAELQSAHSTLRTNMVAFRSSLTEFTCYALEMVGDDTFFSRYNAGSRTILWTGSSHGVGIPVSVRVKMIGAAWTVWETDIGDSDTPADSGTDGSPLTGAGELQVFCDGHYMLYMKASELG